MKKNAVLVLILFLVPGFAGNLYAKMPEKLRITYVKYPLNVPAVVVKNLGLLEKEFSGEKIAIERPEITSGGKQTQAMAAGSIDIASVISSTSAITARANGVDIKIVGIFARAPKAFNVMAMDPNIRTVSDLKGKTIGGPKGSLLNQTLFAALHNESIQPGAVNYVHMPVPKAMAALLGKSIDAALIAGPGVPKAKAQGAHIVVNGEGLVKGLIVTAVRGQFLEMYPEIVKRYLRVQKDAIAFMTENPQKTYEIVAQETGLGIEDVKNMYSWYNFDPEFQPADITDLKDTQKFLLDSGMLEKPTSIEDMIEDLTAVNIKD